MTCVIAALAYGVVAVGVVLAGWAGISVARRWPTGEVQMVVAIVLEAAVLVQTVIGLVRLSGAGLAEPVTFVAYSIGILIPVPLGFQLARLERSHWGSAALGFTALVAAVMTLRLMQLWGAFGA